MKEGFKEPFTLFYSLPDGRQALPKGERVRVRGDSNNPMANG